MRRLAMINLHNKSELPSSTIHSRTNVSIASKSNDTCCAHGMVIASHDDDRHAFVDHRRGGI